MATEYALRPGVVINKYAPDDDGSQSKKYWEYDVQCMIRQGHDGKLTPHTYPNCFLTSMFGGVADYHFWAPRIEERSKNDDGTTKDGGVKMDPDSPDMGSNVLILCSNGQAGESSYIVGCIHHDLAAEAPKELGDGAYQELQYNGLNVKINKDGELVIERRGPTKVDGKFEATDDASNDNDDKAGAKLTLDKAGAIRIETGDGKQIIKLDLENGKIEVQCDKGMDINVENGKLETTCGQGVKLGGDEHLVLGDKYTEAEDAFLSDLQGKLTDMATHLTSLAATVATINFPVQPSGGAAASLAVPLGILSAQIAVPFTKFKTELKTKVLSKKNTTE